MTWSSEGRFQVMFYECLEKLLTGKTWLSLNQVTNDVVDVKRLTYCYSRDPFLQIFSTVSSVSGGYTLHINCWNDIEAVTLASRGCYVQHRNVHHKTFNIMDAQTSNYPQLFIIRWMSPNIWKAVFFFVRWKANFLGCQSANRNQMYTVTLHQAAGLSAAGSKRGTGRGRDRKSDRDEARQCYIGQLKLSVFFTLFPIMMWGRTHSALG